MSKIQILETEMGDLVDVAKYKELEKENAALREELATIRAALAEAIEEADACHDDEHGTPSPNLDAARAVLAKLKQKNGGDSAIDTELRRLGYPL